MKIFRYFVQAKGRPTLIADVQAESEAQAEFLLRARPDVQLMKKGKQVVTAELKGVFDIDHDEASTQTHRDMNEISRHLAQVLDGHLPKNAKIGFTLFLVDLEPPEGDSGFISYVSSVQREGMLRAVEAWVAMQRAEAAGPAA